MRLAIASNCQTVGLGKAMRRLVENAVVDTFSVGELVARGRRHELLQSFREYDQVWIMPLGPQFGDFSEDRILEKLPNGSVVPTLLFFGFHPDLTYLPAHCRHLPSPLDDYHSIIAIAGFLSGRTVYETAQLFNPLVYARLGYFARYERELRSIIQTYGYYGLSVERPVSAWQESGCFMHSPNHPKPHVIHDLARILLGSAGIAYDGGIGPEGLEDTLVDMPQFPIYPELASRLGADGSLLFKTATPRGTQPVWISLEAFVRGSFDAYRRASVAALHSATGVQAALEALRA